MTTGTIRWHSRTTNRSWAAAVGAVALWGVLGVWALPCRGGVPMADWLPADVKFHLSVADYPTAKPLFDQTKLGQLLADAAMKPFLDGLPDQLKTRAQDSWFGLMWVDLGVPWERLGSAASGELSWAVFEVEKAPASVLLADVTGKRQEVAQLEGQIVAAMAKHQVVPKRLAVQGVQVTLYELPQRGKVEATTLVHCVASDVFMATRQLDVLKRLIPRVGREQPDNVIGLATHQHVMSECRKAAKSDPHATLYLVPFDCLDMMSTVAAERDVEVERTPEVYRTQGFDALSAIGASIVIKQGENDFSFFASLYAPKPWSKSMKMFDLRNGPLDLASWVDQKLSSCSILNLHAASVYGNLGPFFDEVVAQVEGSWDDILYDLREVADGPHLDLEKEILQYLESPALVIENDTLPVTPDSPQVMLAIKLRDDEKLAAGLRKGMGNDPLIKQKKVAGATCYYAISDIDPKQVLWIFCVARGYLLMANDFALLTPILEEKTGAPLADDPAFQKAAASRQSDLPAQASTVSFYRLDRWARVRLELLRNGERIPEHRSLGGMLNSFLGGMPAEEPEEQLDGSKLPPFEQIQKYFGTFEAGAVTGDKGWFMSGHVR